MNLQNVAAIDWPVGKGPPPDVPKCGFEGELCEIFDIFAILLCLALVLLVVLLIGSLLIFKHYKEEADIASMTWKIELEEIKEIRYLQNLKLDRGSINEKAWSRWVYQNMH